MIKKIDKEEIEFLPILSGPEFKKLRIMCGISQGKLALHAGRSARSMVSAWERQALMKPYQVDILRNAVRPDVFYSSLMQINKYPN